MEQGIAGVQARHYFDVIYLEQVGGLMDEQHWVHIESDALGLLFPIYPREFAYYTRERAMCSSKEEFLIYQNAQAFRLSCPIDGLCCSRAERVQITPGHGWLSSP